MSTDTSATNRDAAVEFNGSGFGLLGWSLLMGLATVVVVPAAWASAAFYRWLFTKVRLSDGTTTTFVGRGEEIWGWYALSAVCALLPQAGRLADDPNSQMLATNGLTLLITPFACVVGVIIVRWVVRSIRSTRGTTLAFTGTWGAYLGWTLLIWVSALTIIGWAWATVAMMNWFCRNIDAQGDEVLFTGTGGQVLWRVIVGALACGFIIPIPWILAWWYRWGASCLVVRHRGAAPYATPLPEADTAPLPPPAPDPGV